MSYAWVRELLWARDEFPEPRSLHRSCQLDVGRTIGDIRPLNSRILYLGRTPRWRFTIALLAWSAGLFGAFELMYAIDRPLSLAVTGYLVLVAALAITCVHVGYERFRFHRWSIAALSEDVGECERHRLLLRRTFSLAWQVPFSVAGAGWATLLTWKVRLAAEAGSSQVVWIAWSVMLGILLGNGAYWALVTPEYLRRVVQPPCLVLDPLSPGSTPGLRALSSMLGTYAVMNAIACTTIIGGMAFLIPRGVDWRSLALSVHAFIGGAIVLYSFVFPQLMLARAVTRYRAVAESELIAKIRTCLEAGPSSADNLEYLTDQMRSLRSSPATPVAAAVIWKYLTSALIPLLGFLLVHRELFAPLGRVAK